MNAVRLHGKACEIATYQSALAVWEARLRYAKGARKAECEHAVLDLRKRLEEAKS